jgi:phospholipase/carboxylesterase
MQRRRIALTIPAAVLLISACGLFAGPDVSTTDARISVQFHAPTRTLQPGRHPLNLGSGSRDGFLFIPDAGSTTASIPLIVLLHGASGSAANWNGLLATADALDFAILAPDSRAQTWDYRTGGFGPDIRFIEDALAFAIDRVNIDPARMALGGFSDGATYGLSIGLNNGDLFKRLIGFSPSVPLELEARGKPPIFIAHGTFDNVLPVEDTRDITVPRLRGDGYVVKYEEFAGGHTVVTTVAQHAFDWWLLGQ